MDEISPFPEERPEVDWVLFAKRYLRRTGNWDGVYAIWETIASHRRLRGKPFPSWKEFARQIMGTEKLG